MPNDEGLRRCKCGQYVLVGDMDFVDTADSSELPCISYVPDARLPECIEQAGSEDVEVAARLGYWRLLNHRYREKYRQHRDAEEAATKAEWESRNPDLRTWWDRFRGRKALSYRRPPGSPFTCPAFEPTDEQRQNMRRLIELLKDRGVASRQGSILELAELYRETGRFDEAEGMIKILDESEVDVTSKLIARLIKEKQTAPIRYRL